MAFVRTRRTIYAANSLSVPGSMSLGVYNTGAYSKLVGIVSCTGSVTIQYKMGISSGTVSQVTSSFAVNSGPSTFDVVNYGMHTEFWLSAANSQILPSLLIFGEASR